MVTLKADQSSYHASSIKRRDARHDNGTDETPKHRARKNRKKWCRGVEGREHQVEDRPYIMFGKWRPNRRCSECGRKFYAWKGLYG